MADILIRGMEMPKTCCQCDLKIYDPEKRWDENGIERIGAWVCKRTREIIWNTKRGDNCPLVPLPEGHGRLVDLDKLDYAFSALRFNEDGSLNHWDDRKNWCLHGSEIETILANAQTIVPAEGGTDECSEN